MGPTASMDIRGGFLRWHRGPARSQGASAVHAATAHGLFLCGSIKLRSCRSIDSSPGPKELVAHAVEDHVRVVIATDSLSKLQEKVKQLSVLTLCATFVR